MHITLKHLVNKGQTIAVATSGGKDSMALLHFMHKNAHLFDLHVIAINVEHGIRGQNSINDSFFVKDYCQKNNIPCLSYSVDSLKKANEEKLSIEQSARMLRYECFFHAISSGKCDKVATAHHAKDNLETVLFNLFRGTGSKGLGIKENYQNKIIRPFLSVQKEKIDQYVELNNIPFVTDETNQDPTYTRNNIRLNILPAIKQIFPEVETSVMRFCELSKIDDEYLDEQASNALLIGKDDVKITIPLHKALFARAVIKALQHLGVQKDWEKNHIDSAFSLIDSQNGASVDLLKGITAVREYDKITFYRKTEKVSQVAPFSLGKTILNGKTLSFEVTSSNQDLKSDLFFDLDKLPKNTVIRFKKDGDRFTKFGGGTKDLNDYLCDKKIPLRLRDNLPLLASDNKILLIAGVAISNDIKVDETTQNIIKFTEE